jgi:hypothetical protein
MSQTVSGSLYMEYRARLERRGWKLMQAGADGLGAWRHGPRRLHLIHSVAFEGDGQLWEHISLSRDDHAMPSWEQVRDTFRAVAGDDATGIVVIPPKAKHVNISEVAHAWRCLSRDVLPDFTHGSGSI